MRGRRPNASMMKITPGWRSPSSGRVRYASAWPSAVSMSTVALRMADSVARRRLRRLAAALGRAVTQVDDARPERAGLGQLQAEPVLDGREERRAAAQYHRAHEELELVDESCADERGRQSGAPDAEVLPRLRLQPRHLLGDAVPDEPRVALDPLERRRDDDLGQGVPDRRELAPGVRQVRVLLRRVPVAHLLVEPPAAEVGAVLGHPAVVEAMELRVGRRPVDLAARPGDEAVQRDG